MIIIIFDFALYSIIFINNNFITFLNTVNLDFIDYNLLFIKLIPINIDQAYTNVIKNAKLKS